jgi:hypothetical protein
MVHLKGKLIIRKFLIISRLLSLILIFYKNNLSANVNRNLIIKYNLKNIHEYGKRRKNSVFNKALKQISRQPECIETCNEERKRKFYIYNTV